MDKLYNTFNFCSSNFYDFFIKIDPSLSKPQINFLSDFFTSLLSSSSINFDKLAIDLSRKYSHIKLDSILKRISRFLNNDYNNFHILFDNLIYYIFSNFTVKHPDNRIFISFDHMFVKDKFTVLMLSLKVGKQGFPIFFKVFAGKHDDNFGDAFSIHNLKNSLLVVHNLIKSFDPNINIVFLADRWFGNLFPLFNYINTDLNDSFVFRCKDNFKVFYQPKGENNKIWTSIHDLPSLKYHSTFFSDLEFTKNKYIYNLTICKSSDHKERWFLISNIDPTRAKKFYGYRFGGIETIFKNQKSNGFYLEKTGIKHLHAFDNLYSLLCTALCFCIGLGTSVSKNSSSYKDLGFRTTRKNKNGNYIRIVSLFQTGLKLFKLALNSPKYYKLPFNFVLYDT